MVPEKKATKKQMAKVPELPYVTIDLSFIPAEKMTPELKMHNNTEIINPYLADWATTMKSLGGGNDAVKRFKDAEKKFHDFDFTFRQFAMDQFIAKDLQMAAQCFMYLINNIHADSREKEHLLKIYDNLFN
jgi:hypothetical protein